jgi:LAGLIDADG endonuclease
LINIILPIFDKFPLLSNKQFDFLRFKEALLSGITFFEDLPNYTRPTNPLNSVNKNNPDLPKEGGLAAILSVPYFSS